MIRIIIMSFVFISAYSFASPSMFYRYSSGSGEIKIVEAKGAVSLTEMDAECQPTILAGVVESVEYLSGTAIPQGFNLKTKDGFVTHVGINNDELSKLISVDLEWFAKLVKRNAQLVVVGVQCGASGKYIDAKDIFKNTAFK